MIYVAVVCLSSMYILIYIVDIILETVFYLKVIFTYIFMYQVYVHVLCIPRQTNLLIGRHMDRPVLKTVAVSKTSWKFVRYFDGLDEMMP